MGAILGVKLVNCVGYLNGLLISVHFCINWVIMWPIKMREILGAILVNQVG
jgi:hypothetical protein